MACPPWACERASLQENNASNSNSSSPAGLPYLASLHCHVMLLVLPPHHAAAEAAQRACLLSGDPGLPLLGAAAQRGALRSWVGLLLLAHLLLSSCPAVVTLVSAS